MEIFIQCLKFGNFFKRRTVLHFNKMYSDNFMNKHTDVQICLPILLQKEGLT